MPKNIPIQMARQPSAKSFFRSGSGSSPLLPQKQGLGHLALSDECDAVQSAVECFGLVSGKPSVISTPIHAEITTRGPPPNWIPEQLAHRHGWRASRPATC